MKDAFLESFYPVYTSQVCFFSAAELCVTTQLSAKLPLSLNQTQMIHQDLLSLPLFSLHSLFMKHSYLDKETSLILRNIAGKPSHLLTKVTPPSLLLSVMPLLPA